ncbi:hypothetical protein LTR17_022047 [Elasticomyces elasticus]|nr:hypothetical protein LTR17_022047 [Elasticomyces elasticus]
MTSILDPAKPYNILADHFKEPARLWQAMAQYCAILSGSRSADAFLPGTATTSSDFDFYVPYNVHCIVGMIKAFEAAGVKFKWPFYHILNTIATGGNLYRTRREVELLVQAFDRMWESTLFPQGMLSVMAFYRATLSAKGNGRMETTIDIGGKCVVLVVDCVSDAEQAGLGEEMGSGEQVKPDEQFAYEHLPGLDVIHGAVAGGPAVQLIFGPAKAALDHVLCFHSSVVQSFLSPYGGVHLYYTDSKNKVAWIWSRNVSYDVMLPESRLQEVEEALQKYHKRGYYMLSKSLPGEVVVRHALDEHTLFVELAKTHNVDPAITYQRVQQIKGIMRLERAESTEPVLASAFVDSGHTPTCTQNQLGRTSKETGFMLNLRGRDAPARSPPDVQSINALFMDADIICKKYAIDCQLVSADHPDSVRLV